MRFRIDIENSAGTKYGEGPVASAEHWEDTRRLDRAGTFASQMPGGDPRSALVQHKRVARCWTVIQETVTEVGAGIIDQISKEPQSSGQIPMPFGGDDLLRELAYRHVGDLSIDDGAGGPDVTGPDDIMGLAPAGWSLDTDRGFEATATEVLHAFKRETVLQALTKLAELTGEHFRLGTGRKVVWLRRAGSAKVTHGGITGVYNADEAVTGQTSGATGTVVEATASYLYIEDVDGSFVDGEDIDGDVTGASVTVTTAYNPASGVVAVQAGNVVAMEDNEDICIITRLIETEDSYDGMIGRVYATGSGNGDAILTLNGATITPPAGYTLGNVAGKGYYLQHDATWASYGIERVLQVKDVADVDALYYAAYEYLRIAKNEGNTAYSLEVTKLDRAVEVGDTIRVHYLRSLEQPDGTAYRGFDLDADLYVLEKSTRLDADGLRTVRFKIATVDAWPDGDTGTLLETMEAAQAMGSHGQPVDGVDLSGDIDVSSAHIGGASHYLNVDSAGNLTLVGNARVYKYEWISASALGHLGTKPATLAVNGNGYIVSACADAQQSEVQINIKVPSDCDDSADVVVCVAWSSPTADPGDDSKQASWRVTYLATGLGDSTDAAGTLGSKVAASASTSADGLVLTEVEAINIVSGDICIHLKVERVGDDASDTLGDLVELHGIALKYVSNKLGE